MQVYISDRTQILGTANIAGPEKLGIFVTHGCLWDGYRLTDLEADPRFRGTRAVHITQAGAVYATSPPQGPRKGRFTFWFFPSGFGPGRRHDVGIIGSDKISPTAINDAGMVVGTWDIGLKRNKQPLHHAFVWHIGDTHWTDIGTFGGAQSEPAGINNVGQDRSALRICGTIRQVMSSEHHAFLWEKGKLKDLGTLPGGNFSHPYAINNKGQIVGFSTVNDSSIDFAACFMGHTVKIKDLTKLISSGTQNLSRAG